MDNKMTAEQAIEALVRGCELEFTGTETEVGDTRCEDCEPVASGMDGDSHITFGMIRNARKALTTLSAPSVPDGWKLVPVEPTKAMKYAAESPIDSIISCRQSSQHAIAEAAWKSMLAASPEPVAPQPVCVVCDGKGSVETDNNGPIVICPVCQYDDPKAPAVAQANDKQLIADLRAELAEVRQRNGELEALVYAPGLKRCPKCGLHAVHSVISVNDGVMKHDDSPAQCPNGCGPMWRVTERQWRHDVQHESEAAYEKHRAEVEALRKDAEIYKQDSERLAFVYSDSKCATDDLLNIEFNMIQGICPTIDEARAAIDAARLREGGE